MARCVAYKTVYSRKLGKEVRRCARFGETELGQPTGKRCVAYKTVRTKYGAMVRRCAKFAGAADMGELGGRYKRCVAYKIGPSGLRRCAKYAPV